MHNVTCFNVFILHIHRIKKDDQTCSPLVNFRSSGLRVSTAVGSTSTMLSTGGFAMPILSRDLQYPVRKPISPGAAISSLIHGLIKLDHFIDILCRHVFIDSSMHLSPKWITLTIDMDSLR